MVIKLILKWLVNPGGDGKEVFAALDTARLNHRE